MRDPLTALTRAARRLRLRLRSLTAGRRLDAELDDELAFHAAMAEEDARSRGASAADLAGELAPDVTVESVATMDARVAEALGQPRTRAWLVTAFAAVALLLAAIGLYGLLAGEVAARVREIGIRLTLGAARRQILAHTLRRGITLTVLGAGSG
jgi:predicted lysophospholipase L1 biosynthesis ABC-type transport system permease subunit